MLGVMLTKPRPDLSRSRYPFRKDLTDTPLVKGSEYLRSSPFIPLSFLGGRRNAHFPVF